MGPVQHLTRRRFGEVERQPEGLQHPTVASEGRPDPDTWCLMWTLCVQGWGTWILSSALPATDFYLRIFTHHPLPASFPSLLTAAEWYLRTSVFNQRSMQKLSPEAFSSAQQTIFWIQHCSEASSPFKKGKIFLFAKGSVSHRERDSCGINKVQVWGYTVYKRKALRQW